MPEIAPRDVRAERQGQAGLAEPPLAEIDDLLQPGGGVRELALVDEQARVRLPRRDLVHDLVERNLPEREVPELQLQRQERRRHAPGHGDLDPAQVILAQLLARDDDRPVAGAHARAVRKQDVLVLHVRVRVERDRGHLEPALERPLVQRLDVLQHVLELEPARVDLARGEAPEHERVVRVGAMAEADEHDADANSQEECRLSV